MYDRLKQIATREERPVASVVDELLSQALPNYCPTWMTNELLEKFDALARRALTLAHEEAHRYGHNYIGTEHLLLGLLRESEGVAARALGSLGVDLQAVRGTVEDMLGGVEGQDGGESLPPPGWLPYMPRLRKVLMLAWDEAQRLGHDYVGTEHLLLGIVREGVGAAILKRFGALDEAARVQTIALLDRRGDADGQD